MVQGEANHSVGTSVGKKKEKNILLGEHHGVETNFDGMKYPRTVLYHSVPHPKKHPTQKPVDLLLWLIRTHSDVDGLVFDPFCGIGSTHLACMETGRNFLGSELSDEYCKIWQERIGQQTLGL